ncbi:MAG TPA: hypothetical protein VFC07_16685, partial [Verrucomicrobiae bacterium]|nr:hypothetical protein [Verrucomicrobiae bacterium]
MFNCAGGICWAKDSPQTGLPPQSVAQAGRLKARHAARFAWMPGTASIQLKTAKNRNRFPALNAIRYPVLSV